MIQFSKGLLAALIILGLTYTSGISADPMKFRESHKHSNSDYTFHSYKRYKQNPIFNRFPNYSPNIRKKHIYWAPKKHKHHFKPDVVYVLPAGSRVLIYNGDRYYRWQDRYYKPTFRENKKAYISVNLSF